MRIVLIGAPACGKGTQSALLSKEYNLVHISTGDIFRDILKQEGPLKQEVDKYVNNGLLVPDELTLKLVKNRLSQLDKNQGYLLDGFPRNVNQAKLLRDIAEIDYAIYIDTPFETLLSRSLNRRVCPSCKKIFVKSKYKSEFCDECNTKLTTRADDNEQMVEKRFNEFKKSTYPVVEYYENLGKLIRVNGEDLPENIFKFIKMKIDK